MSSAYLASLPSLLTARMADLDSPYKLLYGGILLLLIVYAPILPESLRVFTGSFLGRIVMMAGVYLSIETLGWVYGLLTAMAFLVVLMGVSRSPSYASTEGFYDGGGTVTEKRRMGRRWFVERVLGEHPEKIATDKVTTSAVQDA